MQPDLISTLDEVEKRIDAGLKEREELQRELALAHAYIADLEKELGLYPPWRPPVSQHG